MLRHLILNLLLLLCSLLQLSLKVADLSQVPRRLKSKNKRRYFILQKYIKRQGIRKTKKKAWGTWATAALCFFISSFMSSWSSSRRDCRSFFSLCSLLICSSSWNVHRGKETSVASMKSICSSTISLRWFVKQEFIEKFLEFLNPPRKLAQNTNTLQIRWTIPKDQKEGAVIKYTN